MIASEKPFIIYGRDTTPYLIRWTIFKWRGWTVRFHCFLRSDEDDMHDHPWSFVSIMLAGSYREHTLAGVREYKAPYILHRRAEHRHRVEIAAPCLTLVITAPKRRDWGFWTKDGFLCWRKYFGQPRC